MSGAPSTLVLGLDLGNSAGCCAVLRNATLDVVPNEQGSRVTPAAVAFTEVETLLGEPARTPVSYTHLTLPTICSV